MAIRLASGQEQAGSPFPDGSSPEEGGHSLPRPSLHGQVGSKLSGTMCVECPVQRTPQPICNKQKGGVNQKRDTVTGGALFRLAVITAKLPFTVWTANVSFNQPASAQPLHHAGRTCISPQPLLPNPRRSITEADRLLLQALAGHD